jgi:hypothetical protein
LGSGKPVHSHGNVFLSLDFIQYLGLNREIMKTLICAATFLELMGGISHPYVSQMKFHLNTLVDRMLQIGIAGAYAGVMMNG